MSRKSEFKEDKAATVQQSERKLVALKKELDSLNAEIKKCKGCKSDLHKFLDDACVEKIRELDLSIQENKDSIKELRVFTDQSKTILAKLEKEKADFAIQVKKENEWFHKVSHNAEVARTDLSKSKSEQREKNENEKKEIRILREEADKVIAEASAKTKTLENLKEGVKKDFERQDQDDFRLIKKEGSLTEREIALDGREGSIDTHEAEVDKEKEENLVILKGIVTENEKLDKKQEALKVASDQNKTEKTDAVLLGKKNAIEADRQKKVAKDLLNKEVRLNDQEKVLNTKIGG